MILHLEMAIFRNPASTEASPEAAFATAPVTTLLVRSTFPDRPPEAARGKIAPEIRIHPRAGRKTSPDRPKGTKIRRIKEMGSSVG